MKNDLISRSALREALCGNLKRVADGAYFKLRNEAFRMESAIMKAIDAAPTADAALVRHARWIEDCTEKICSECKAVYSDEIICMNKDFKFDDLPYCPNCGAKMDAEVKR